MAHFEPFYQILKRRGFLADKGVMKILILPIVILMLTACNSSSSSGGAGAGNNSLTEGLQYSGSIVISSHLVGPSSLKSQAVISKVEISAPIFPKMNELYSYEGNAYPSTFEGVIGAVENVSMVFTDLLNECKTFYPAIVLSTEKNTLTSEELTSNYNLVAQCSYEKFSSKPYWIPQMLSDVDVCSVVMGSSWRLMTEADLNSLLSSQLQYLEQTLSTVKGASSGFWGDFYFGLKTYAKGDDTLLKIGDLSSTASQKVSDLGLDSAQMKSHYEGGGSPVGVRCIRVLE